MVREKTVPTITQTKKKQAAAVQTRNKVLVLVAGFFLVGVKH